MEASLAAETLPKPKPNRYLTNVLWSWAGVALNLIIGFRLTPYVIHKLGASGYGIWVLVFSMVGYYGLLELGFRSALVRYSAYYHAQGQFDEMNTLINTVIGYYTAMSGVLLVIAMVVARFADRLFHVAPEYHDEFTTLLMICGFSAMVGVNVFGATLEGLQAFDIGTKVYLVTLALRAIGTFLLLYFGFGLIALLLNVIAVQILGYIGAYWGLRKVFPQLKLSFWLVKLSMLKHIAGYAAHTFLATIATQMLNQTPALVIGIFRPTAFIGYYSFPVRTMQYGLDFVMRVGLVSASRAAELSAKSLFHEVLLLAENSNRYCLALFLPVSIYLLPYGHPLISVWVGSEFARYSAPILPIVVLSITTAYVAQFNSSSILFGIGKHKGYSRGLLVEAAMNVSAMFVLIPWYGITGAAWAAAIPMMLVRGLYTPALLCRNVGGSFFEYMRAIFLAPLLTAIPVLGFAYYLQRTALPGRNWPQLIAAAALVAASYWTIALFTSVKPEHRSGLMARAKSLLQPLRAAVGV